MTPSPKRGASGRQSFSGEEDPMGEWFDDGRGKENLTLIAKHLITIIII